MAIDELVDSVTVYKKLPLYLHGYISPFVVFYVLALYFNIFVGRYCNFEQYEIFLFIVVIVAMLHVLVCLCSYWSIHVRCFLSCRQVKNPCEGELVKVKPTPNNGYTDLVKLNHFESFANGAIWFSFRNIKYLWCEKRRNFCSLEFPVSKTFGEYIKWQGYVEEDELSAANRKYGLNMLNVIVPKEENLFFKTITNPVLIYFITCMILCYLDAYSWYFLLIQLWSIIMIGCRTAKTIRVNMDKIRVMNKTSEPYVIQVYRNKGWKGVPSNYLLPGDIVSIGKSYNNTVPCDLLLIRGSCIVDESMLTGEAVPQMKESIENFDPNKILDLEVDRKLHILCGGTKVIQYTLPSCETSAQIEASNDECIAYVLRTGFSTWQGKLLRTMLLLPAVRLTYYDLEILFFHLFQSIFAVAAFAYLWVNVTQDPEANRYELFLRCVFIFTLVDIPQLLCLYYLPTYESLQSLSKLRIFCLERSRIFFAGKVQICCFNKTGTLTSNDFVVKGITGVGETKNAVLLSRAPSESVQVLATCHSLIRMRDCIVGDPFEKVTFTAIDWVLSEDDVVISKRVNESRIKIFHRFHFSSTLRRMSVLAGYTNDSTKTSYIATVKGAPETMKSMFVNIDENYDKEYSDLCRHGAHVLALGWKEMGYISDQRMKNLDRSDLESDLKFAGFISFSCRLKLESKAVIKELLFSNHMVVMITGDNPLTACYVAKELLFTQKKGGILILTCMNEKFNEWAWQSINEAKVYPLENHKNFDKFAETYDLCVPGDGLMYLNKYYPNVIRNMVQYVSVFARVSPEQKEFIIVTLKSLGYVTLMCSEGSNDVGALKHADVGVALVPILPEQHDEPEKNPCDEWMAAGDERLDNGAPKKLGEAIITAPFTSQSNSIQCVCHIIKRGRWALAIQLQFFKIVALIGIIFGYSLSVLYSNGIKPTVWQIILVALFMSALWTSLAWQLSTTLSPQKPLPNIFNVYTISTIFSQGFVYVFTLVFLAQQSRIHAPTGFSDEPPLASTKTTEETKLEFEANVINSTICITSIGLTMITFAINSSGCSFMNNILKRALLYTLLASSCFIVMFCLGTWPLVSTFFDIVEFDCEYRFIILGTLLAVFVTAYVCDRFYLWLFGKGKLNVRNSAKFKVFPEV